VSTRDWKLRLEDILEAIERIEQYTEGFHYEQWQRDQKTIDAVIRNIEIIGEASTHVPAEVQTLFPNIPWRKMRGIRNILVHEYFGVDVEVLWRTVQEDLPGLKVLLSDAFKGKDKG
jgi:uncharacterized protein with HEPN domain